MIKSKTIFALMGTLLFLSACSKVIPPHTVIKCKLNYDKCMIVNTFEGPLRSHQICLAERAPVCHALP